MKKIKIILLALIIFALNSNLFSISTSELINKVNQFFIVNKSFKGKFELYEGKKKSNGYFLYKTPNYFKMVFGDEKGSEENKKRIISDTKTLWVYLPHLRVVIDQDLSNIDDSSNISTQDLGFRKFISHYDCQFENNDSRLKRVRDLADKSYVLELKSKNEGFGFEKLIFYIREDGFIIKSVAYDHEKNVYTLIRTDIQLNAKIEDSQFNRTTPERAKVIKNPFAY